MKILAAVLLACLCSGAGAQTRHDPLNPREVDQLRDSAQYPKKRIDLLISFAKERMLAVERLRGDTQSANQSAAQPANQPTQLGLDDSGKMADLLADLAAVIDELDDNLDMYNGHSEDLRRPLRHVLDAEAEFLLKLESLSDNASALQKRHMGAALEDASDSVKTSIESARVMLAEQIEKKGEEKNKGKLDRQEAKRASGTD